MLAGAIKRTLALAERDAGGVGGDAVRDPANP